MSTYNPTSFHFNYKKFVYAQIPAVVVITLPEIYRLLPIRNARITSALPPWLEVYNLLANNIEDSDNNISFSLRLKNEYIDHMVVANYSTTIRFSYESYFGFFWVTKVVSPNYTVAMQVIDTVLLNVTPSNLLFNYTIGAALPSSKIAQIIAESNWSVASDKSWVTLSNTNGVGNSQLIIGVDPSSLTVGSYDATVLIQDGNRQENIVVTFVIDEGDTPTSFLYVNPRNLEFVSEFNKPNTKEFNLNIETSHSWTTTVSESWIVLSATTGNSGVQNVTVSVDSIGLETGIYTGFIDFISNSIMKKVYISLRVIAFLEDGINSETLYFAKDRNELKVTNVADNTFLVLDFVTSTTTNNLPYQKQAPFYQGVSRVLIGEETEDLLLSKTPTNTFTTRIVNSIKPLNISFSSFIENKISGAITPLGQYSNVRFLNGHTPMVPNKLGYIPSTIYLTNKGVVSISILSFSLPESAEITGDATATITAALASDLYVYNLIVDLASLNLVTGNNIAIKFGDITTNVVVKEPAIETTLLAFENEWNEYEFFECTGFFTKTIDVKKRTTTVQVEGKQHTKITSLDVGYKYTVNTGNIYSQEEKDWLSTLLIATKAFIYIDGSPVEIIMKTKSLQIYKTREHTKSYDLKFIKAIV